MTQENAQVAQRRTNAAELVQLGVAPYPNRYAHTDTVAALVSAHGATSREELDAGDPITTATAGRILAIRSFGKANFLVIGDGEARIQVYVRQDSLAGRDYATFRLLDFGDYVGVAGRVFRTKTHELTIWATALEFLASPETPRAVVINEALELARTFSTEPAVKFVNGVLDAVRRAVSAPPEPR